jgi:WS/DGAT/MGAT family acyltransferase
VGLFVKMHHAMADGVAGVAALGVLLDQAADATAPAAPPWRPAQMPTNSELLRDNVRRRVQGLDRALSTVAEPIISFRRVREGWPALREFLAEDRAPRTSLNGRAIGRDRRLGIVRSRLDTAKEIAHAHNAKVNDVLLAAVASGLRDLLESREENVEDLVLRAMVPVSLHGKGSGNGMGNQDGAMVVPIPLGETDTVRRLRLIAGETRERKKKPRPQAATGIFRFAAVQRAAFHLLARQHLVNFNLSNVPGPPMPLYLAGAQVVEVFPVVPIGGNESLGVGALSYAGQLNLTAVADWEACPHLDVFVQGVRRGLDEMTHSVLAPIRRWSTSEALDGRGVDQRCDTDTSLKTSFSPATDSSRTIPTPRP